MAVSENSPHIKRVLSSYKVHAMSSLHGPGTEVIINHNSKSAKNEEPLFYNYKKKFNFHEHTKKIESRKGITSVSIASPSSKLGCGTEALGQISPKSCVKSENVSNNANDCAKISENAPSSVVLTSSGAKLIAAAEKKAELKTTAAVEVRRPNDDDDDDDFVKRESGGDYKWVEPRVFLAPAPFPPQPLPILATADPGVLPSHNRSETLIDGNPIACFVIGGEPRLCLPQILNTLLKNFSVAQINSVCDELQIFCSRCTPRQLEYLKDTGTLPPTATSCGLITKTDAQRLTHALIYAHISRPLPKSIILKHDKSHQIKVSHNCFGKCKGLIWPELYNSYADPCILCIECNNLYTAQQFVCHAHRALENRTCHWGFDAENWRHYLTLSKDQTLPLQKAEEGFAAFKNKFDISSSHKRKQNPLNYSDELVKKLRCDESNNASFFQPPGVGSVPGGYDPILANYLAWNSFSAKPPTWAVVPLVTKDGKPLPLPPAVFTKECIPSSSSLPSYFSQGPPVLVDPGRVVPISETEKFERNFQPNVALAPLPPKVREKIAREALKCEQRRCMSNSNCLPSHNVVYQNRPSEVSDVDVEKIKPLKVESHSLSNGLSLEPKGPLEGKEEPSMPPSPPISSPTNTSSRSSISSEHQGGCSNAAQNIDKIALQDRRSTPADNRSGVDSRSNAVNSFKMIKKRLRDSTDSHCHSSLSGVDKSQFGKYSSDLECSNSDSETESISSVSSKSEIVEEAEALLRGWTDRAAARKVLEIVASLAKSSMDHRLEALRSRGESPVHQLLEKSTQTAEIQGEGPSNCETNGVVAVAGDKNESDLTQITGENNGENNNNNCDIGQGDSSPPLAMEQDDRSPLREEGIKENGEDENMRENEK